MTLSTKDLGQSVAGRWLFRELNMEAPSGSITAVIGPNGSGKSTLLRKLAGLEQPEEGSVHLDGEPLLEVRPTARARRISYLPQTTALYHELSVRELVTLGRAPHVSRFGAPGADDDEAVDRALDRVGVRDLSTRGIFSLSGGERQRVMLARMLCTGAPVLIMDEPTTALDIGHALSFLELCRELSAEGSTIVIALHDLDRARTYSDRAICLGLEAGASRVGSCEEVLQPAILGEVFGVEVTEQKRLAFSPKRATE